MNCLKVYSILFILEGRVNILKIILKRMMLGILVFMLIFSLLIFANHNYQLKREAKLLANSRNIIEYNNIKLHVYTEGYGDTTMVYMSGLGVSAPQYELKSLYSLFLSQYKIAVIDRVGYGYSDTKYSPRTLDNILEQTRATLISNNIKPPYILVPHSISGLEALYWAQQYPKEVMAIIGLDIGLPEEYIEYGESTANNTMLYGYELLAKLGFGRLFPSLAYNEAVLTKGQLSEQEIKIFKAISYKQGFNKNMREEMMLAKQNSELINEQALPIHTPLLLIDAYINQNAPAAITQYNNYQVLANQFTHSKVVQIESTHSLYLHAPNEIYNIANDFIQNLK